MLLQEFKIFKQSNNKTGQDCIEHNKDLGHTNTHIHFFSQLTK